MKTKANSPRLNRWPLFLFRGGLAEWSNAADCKSVNGGLPTVLGFESLIRRQTLTSPSRSANCGQGLNLGLAPKAELFRLTVIVRPHPKKRKARKLHATVVELKQ